MSKSFMGSSIGKKYIMGITGLIWSGFVMSHMLGNLLIFVSADAYNKYGHAITSGGLIYIAETVLALSLFVHMALAVRLTIENKSAKGSRYAVAPNGEKAPSLASRTMIYQGSLIFVFLVYHLITFKFGPHYETTVDGVVMRDLARLFDEVFRQPAYVFGYMICLIVLGFHLSHGVGSLFQSFGLRTDEHAPLIQKLSIGYGVIVALGFISQPLYVFFLR